MSVMAKNPVTPAAVRMASLSFRSSLVVLMFGIMTAHVMVAVVMVAAVVSVSVRVVGMGMLSCRLGFYLSQLFIRLFSDVFTYSINIRFRVRAVSTLVFTVCNLNRFLYILKMQEGVGQTQMID